MTPPANPTPASNGHAPPPGMSLDDVFYTIFRHKWLIVAFGCLGVVGAVTVRLMRPPQYVSQAKLMVHYVSETLAATPGTPEAQNLRTIDGGTQGLINGEIQILTSFDVATNVAKMIGPERILAKKGGGTNLQAAAGAIASGIEVEPPHSSILTVSFRHPDRELVQPVLAALLQAYIEHHITVHIRSADMYEHFIRQRDELRKKLTQRDEELNKMQTDANVLYPEDLKRSYQNQIAKAQDALLEAQLKLAEHKAVLGNLGTENQTLSTTNGAEGSVPAATLAEYGDVISDLESLKKDYHDLKKLYADAYPTVERTRTQIEKLSSTKTNMEHAYPMLARLALDGAHGGTNALGGDVAAELRQARELTARVASLGEVLTNLEQQAAHVMEKAPRIDELKRQRDEEERAYQDVLRKIEQIQVADTASSGKAPNMTLVESPKPPLRDYKKVMKVAGMAFVGCLAMGFGLAFLIDLVLDRSVKRSSDVERKLRLPLFLSIPDTSWTGQIRLPSLAGGRATKARLPAKIATDAADDNETALEPWNPGNPLQIYADGLRERILTFFEVRNLNLKKPKMVAVTGCNQGAGVSTLARGLAGALSKTGGGNVLLVDMNEDQGAAHSFYKGKPGCGLTEALEGDNRAEAQIEENLYVATIQEDTNHQLVKAIPAKFAHLMPKFKASDYDYIIFDMPAVTSTSTTPRLAGYMDLVLLVLESEKTGQHAAARASKLMHESRANVAAVLNKYRQHVPAPLAQE